MYLSLKSECVQEPQVGLRLICQHNFESNRSQFQWELFWNYKQNNWDSQWLECNEIISKIVLKDGDGEHEVSNADSALEHSVLQYNTHYMHCGHYYH